jgi:hypothetical protein
MGKSAGKRMNERGRILKKKDFRKGDVRSRHLRHGI